MKSLPWSCPDCGITIRKEQLSPIEQKKRGLEDILRIYTHYIEETGYTVEHLADTQRTRDLLSECIKDFMNVNSNEIDMFLRSENE